MAGHEDNQGMISCADALRFLQEFVDGELEATSRQQVEAHFEACQRCYPHLQLEESFRAALQRACWGACAPPELKARLLEALAQAKEG